MKAKSGRVTFTTETWTDGARRTITYDRAVVCIIQSDDDPGDMGEPRQWESDDVAYVVVPPWEAWDGLDVDRLARAIVETDPDNLDYLEEGETLGESFYREARPRAEAIARKYAEERLSE